MIYCTVISTKYITDLGKLKRRHCLFIYCTSGMYTKFKIFVDFSFWASDAISIFFSYADLSVFLITLLKYIERWSLSYSNTRFLILLFTSFRLSSLFSNKSILKCSMFKKDVRNFCWLRQRSEFENLVTLSLYTKKFALV